MGNAVAEYTSGDYMDIISAGADFKGIYSQYASIMTEAQKKAAMEAYKNVEKFLANAKKYEGKVYRGLGFDIGGQTDNGAYDDLLAVLNKGNTIDMPSLTSWTKKESYLGDIFEARTDVDETATGVARVKFILEDSKSGVDIAKYAELKAQDEVLFTQKAKYEILNVKKTSFFDDDGIEQIDIVVNLRDAGTKGKVNIIDKLASRGTTSVVDSNGADSLAKYTADSKLIASREKLHKGIVDDCFRNSMKAEGQPVFTVMGGGSAAGKSTMLNAGAVKLTKDTVMVDSDAIKKLLPDYDELLRGGKDNIAAFYVHEESSALAKRIMSVGQKNGYNVTLDGTGDGSVSSLMKKIEGAKAAGCRVEGVYATVPTDVALARSAARAEKTGRVVPNDVIRQTHKKVSQVLPECAEYFDDVKLYDTTDGAILIATGGGGKPLTPVKGQEKRFKSFLEKANE